MLFRLRQNYKGDIDNWYNSTTKEQRLKDNGRFHIGTTSEVLKSINLKDMDFYFGKSKIQKILNKHKNMTIDIIKEVPELLENPIIVMDSVTRKDSLVVLGELYTDKGMPVMAAILIDPKNKKGEVEDFGIISSAYTKENIGRYQNLLNNSAIRYINPDEKRTNHWLSKLRLQLPSQITNYGSISKISLEDGFVNISQNPEKNNDNLNQDRDYSYNELVKKPDVTVSKVRRDYRHLTISKCMNVILSDLKKEKDTVERRGNTAIRNTDTGNYILVTREALRHGITSDRTGATRLISCNVAEAIRNGIKVNVAEGTRNNADSAYVLMGKFVSDSKDTKGTYYYRMVINRYEENKIGIDYIDSMYALKAQKKKISAARIATGVTAYADSFPDLRKIKVSDFLNEVKDYYGDSLSKDVNNHLERERQTSDIEGLRYQERYREPRTYEEALKQNKEYREINVQCDEDSITIMSVDDFLLSENSQGM